MSPRLAASRNHVLGTEVSPYRHGRQQSLRGLRGGRGALISSRPCPEYLPSPFAGLGKLHGREA